MHPEIERIRAIPLFAQLSRTNWMPMPPGSRSDHAVRDVRDNFRELEMNMPQVAATITATLEERRSAL